MAVSEASADVPPLLPVSGGQLADGGAAAPLVGDVAGAPTEVHAATVATRAQPAATRRKLPVTPWTLRPVRWATRPGKASPFRGTAPTTRAKARRPATAPCVAALSAAPPARHL